MILRISSYETRENVSKNSITHTKFILFRFKLMWFTLWILKCEVRQ